MEKKKAHTKFASRVAEKYPEIEVISLAYNSQKFLANYFDAFSRVMYPLDKITLNIIDNASKDDSFAYIVDNFCGENSYPLKVKATRSKKNLGFTGGNNYILKRLLQNRRGAKLYLLLNIDTEIDPLCISELVDSMRSDLSVGMVEARQAPREHPKWYNPDTFETSWCSCGGVLLRAEALKEVGLFDEKFFLYSEDVDLSWRMWLHGWKCKINPVATYSHFTEDLDEDKDHSVQQFYSVRNSLFMRYKYDTRHGLAEHKAVLLSLIEAAVDSVQKELLVKALKDYQKYIPILLIDRLKLSIYPKPTWINFNGFDYGKRRKFVDTEVGERIFG